MGEEKAQKTTTAEKVDRREENIKESETSEKAERADRV